MRGGRRLARALQGLAPRASGPGCTVLCYHLVEAGTGSPVDLPEELFRRQMEEMAATAEVVPLEEAVGDLRRPGPASRRSIRQSIRPRVALTFDDAYRNFHERAFPVLAELGLPATLFVPVGFVEGECPPPLASSAALPAASWGELAEMTASGLVTVGSHTWSHPDLTALPAVAVDDELRRSRERLEERLGRPVRSFCYPRARRSRAVEARVRRHYDLAVVGGGGRFGGQRRDPYRIERVSLRTDGPRSLAPVLRARVWLEERLADRLRRLR